MCCAKEGLSVDSFRGGVSMSFSSDVVIGLEIHVELNTDSKMFCGCATRGEEIPNTRTCPVCLGHPGSKPILNKGALLRGIKLCKSLGCELSDALVFARKSYFYPDMSKNFQVTQYDEPLGSGGSLQLRDGTGVGIMRVHLEEDPASLVHPSGMTNSDYVLIDYNRAGKPLAEIVTHPELTSPQQAREFLNELSRILSYIGVYQQGGVIKADANVSVRESGYTRVEIKNITGFKEVQRALLYEIKRQKAVLRRGKSISQETRGWNPSSKTTIHMRTKESEDDYGYVFEPDLSIVQEVKVLAKEVSLPELPFERLQRFISVYGLSREDAEVMSSSRVLADLFENLSKNHKAIDVARWLRRELLRVLNYASLSVEESPISSDSLSAVIELVSSGKVSENTGQQLMELLVEGSFDVKQYVEDEGLLQVTDSDKIQGLCEEVIKEFPEAVADVRSGEEKALNFLVGQVMRKSKGAAEPTQTRELLVSLVRE